MLFPISTHLASGFQVRLQNAAHDKSGRSRDRIDGSVPMKIAAETNRPCHALILFHAIDQGLDGGLSFLYQRSHDRIHQQVDSPWLTHLSGGDKVKVADQRTDAFRGIRKPGKTVGQDANARTFL